MAGAASVHLNRGLLVSSHKEAAIKGIPGPAGRGGQPGAPEAQAKWTLIHAVFTDPLGFSWRSPMLTSLQTCQINTGTPTPWSFLSGILYVCSSGDSNPRPRSKCCRTEGPLQGAEPSRMPSESLYSQPDQSPLQPLAAHTCVGQRTVALVPGDIINAGPLVQAGVGGTFVDVGLAVWAYRKRIKNGWACTFALCLFSGKPEPNLRDASSSCISGCGLYCQAQAAREDPLLCHPQHSPLKPSRQVHT